MWFYEKTVKKNLKEFLWGVLTVGTLKCFESVEFHHEIKMSFDSIVYRSTVASAAAGKKTDQELSRLRNYSGDTYTLMCV